MRINASTTIAVPANQATFLGTMYTTANGQAGHIYGGAASGGTAASFGICNYYNKVLFNTIVEDNGATYTYTSGTVRQARGSAGNQIAYIQSDSERAANFSYITYVNNIVASAAVITGIGLSAAAFNAYAARQSASSINGTLTTPFFASSAGLTTVFALEQGDGVNANVFDFNSSNLLMGSIWL
jgi:hypothetical protein